MKEILCIAFLCFTGINSLQAQESYNEEEKKAIIEKAQQNIARYQNRTIIKKGTKEYDTCYSKLYALYTKMMNSPEFQEELYQQKIFDKKLNQKIDNSLYREKDAFFVWIEQNINSTEFRNAEAAKEDWLRLRAAQEKTAVDNKEYFDYIIDLSFTYENFSELIVDVVTAERDGQKDKPGKK